MFPEDDYLRQIILIVESTGDSLFTEQTFAEMEQFEDILYSIQEFSDTYVD